MFRVGDCGLWDLGFRVQGVELTVGSTRVRGVRWTFECGYEAAGLLTSIFWVQGVMFEVV